MSASITLENVTKAYGSHLASDDVSLEIGAGRFVTLLGPSGSGKTTLLMMIAGFVRPTKGRILAGGRDITNEPPERREFGMVFQGYALFPNMTVAENLAFPLKLRGVARDAVEKEVRRMLDVVHLPGLGGRYPRELSGGQQQRVALARALIFNPKVLLLDESLSALDKKLRAGLQEELRDLHARLGTTFVFVTHDQEEALSMSDEIVIVNRGRIVQRGAPKALYDKPDTRFVADFLGRANFIEGAVSSLSGREISYGAGGLSLRHALPVDGAAPQPHQPILLGLRPEKLRLASEAPGGTANAVPAEITLVTYEGADYHIRATTPLGSMQAVVASTGGGASPARGDKVWLSWDQDAAVVLRDDR
ncbi:ABC transporter ATP-binding protein [Bosea sp. BH3]|uniref:ABC transporter ATP-binding protein n=1 Tax=Bosea sp. BH3 TaxID=2871701 RepID=UPI0021CB8609|nr:ABC transporter ATP-binding protein [Bosea sp. BH3]MCU4179443.1 ABC transporter ATP-binding protein [Bosea sp. BH3]